MYVCTVWATWTQSRLAEVISNYSDYPHVLLQSLVDTYRVLSITNCIRKTIHTYKDRINFIFFFIFFFLSFWSFWSSVQDYIEKPEDKSVIFDISSLGMMKNKESLQSLKGASVQNYLDSNSDVCYNG